MYGKYEISTPSLLETNLKCTHFSAQFLFVCFTCWKKIKIKCSLEVIKLLYRSIIQSFDMNQHNVDFYSLHACISSLSNRMCVSHSYTMNPYDTYTVYCVLVYIQYDDTYSQLSDCGIGCHCRIYILKVFCT